MSTTTLSKRDQRTLKVALEALKITGLQICKAIEASGQDVVRFDDLAGLIRNKPPQTVIDLSVVYVAIGMAVTKGLIRDPGENVPDESYQHAYELTDAGRFILRNFDTGPKALSILSDIDAEMAGAA